MIQIVRQTDEIKKRRKFAQKVESKKERRAREVANLGIQGGSRWAFRTRQGVGKGKSVGVFQGGESVKNPGREAKRFAGVEGGTSVGGRAVTEVKPREKKKEKWRGRKGGHLKGGGFYHWEGGGKQGGGEVKTGVYLGR